MSHKIKEFGEITIFYNEGNEKFEAQAKEGNIVAFSQSLNTLEENLTKERKRKFQRTPAWKSHGWGKELFERGEITSYNPDTKEAWFVLPNGHSEKKGSRYSNDFGLIKDIPENLKIMQEIIEIKKQVDGLNEKSSTLSDSLKKFSPADLLTLTEEEKDSQ